MGVLDLTYNERYNGFDQWVIQPKVNNQQIHLPSTRDASTRYNEWIPKGGDCMNLKEKLAEAPKVAEKKDKGNVWATKKAEQEALGNTYTPIWLPEKVVNVAKDLAKRMKVRYEEVIAAALLDEENYEVFQNEMKKAE